MSRYLLAFDTSTDDVVVTVAHAIDGTGVQNVIPARRLANTILLDQIDEILDAAQVEKAQIEAIIVGCGPGSFTGVRIGVATAKGLAQGLDIPLFGVSTTDAILWGMWSDGVRGSVEFALDAMRREVYPVSAVISDEGVERDRADYVTARGETICDQDLTRYLPSGLIAAFEHSILSSATGMIGDVLPIYTRLSDAEETARQAAGEPTGAQLMAQGKLNLSGVDEQAATRRDAYIRPLTSRDAEMLYHREAEIFGVKHHPWTLAMFYEEFIRDDRLWLGSFEQDQLIGYVGFALSDRDADMLRLGTVSSHRRRGIARDLLEAAIGRLHRRGIERVILEVRESNEDARAFYLSQGFGQIGMRQKYFLFQEGAEDAIVMARDIAQQTSGQDRKNKQEPTILGIETSCDETAAAVLSGFDVLSNIIASQVKWHARFGGVVPEIASRKHIEAIAGVVDEALTVARVALSDLDAIAVTVKPGLVGALVVGLAYAKGLSYATDLPLIGINHLEGHMVANRLLESQLEPPFVSLIVSGGNTSLVHCDRWGTYRTLGETLDDATGEAFDKVAKVLGLGYPGGPVISKLAQQGDPNAIDFPRAMMHTKDYQFSLSGLKTAVITYINEQLSSGVELDLPDIAASFQQAIIDVQVHKALRAVEETGAKWFCLAGGVAANAALREALITAMTERGIRVSVPPLELCGDNAAMIAGAALFHLDEAPLEL
ncbi:MAG: tRNA (adenosine(37)-N6)-threonylcarbamoyltransferase complex transferase subunit TsaD, partial [Actinomycetia bacterium]|nr:tRNA (adenosine(37)-N6)-threonylcarbamoyltransferase complex transferase subunit TsaD [Actinomycetes bacterium]